MAELRIETVSKTFKDGHEALKGISFVVEDREAVFLLGPSGAGKTTTLRLVAGLEDVTRGRIHIGGRDVTHLTPRERKLAMVYDKHSLFPHMTIFENLAYPLRVRKVSEDKIRERVAQVAATLQVERMMARYPSQLSGGQQQRVAIGRALVRDAHCYLLDEPISHLDAQLRARMRVEFKRLQRDYKATMLYVSHDQLEAMTMADRIVLINKGEIEQIAAPQALFDRPDTIFAATFIGEPAMNTLPAELGDRDGRLTLLIGEGAVPLDRDWTNAGIPLRAGQRYVAGVRPQHISLCEPELAAPGVLHGSIFAVETLGSRVIFDVALAGTIVRVMTSVDAARLFPDEIGAPIAVRLDPDFVYLFDETSGRAVRHARFALRKMS
ncbi:MAG: ABC transporter ATP-binding protein [Alsobacter sp.]